MDLLIASGSVPWNQVDPVPTSGTPQYATMGNKAQGVPATQWPAYHYSRLIRAIVVGLIQGAGLTPDITDPLRILKAVQAVANLAVAPSQAEIIKAIQDTGVPATDLSNPGWLSGACQHWASLETTRATGVEGQIIAQLAAVVAQGNPAGEDLTDANRLVNALGSWSAMIASQGRQVINNGATSVTLTKQNAGYTYIDATQSGANLNITLPPANALAPYVAQSLVLQRVDGGACSVNVGCAGNDQLCLSPNPVAFNLLCGEVMLLWSNGNNLWFGQRLFAQWHQVFATPGGFTAPAVPFGITRARLTGQGAAGGGGAAGASANGAGAGTGGWFKQLFPVYGGQVISGQIGQGGYGGAANGANGASGGGTYVNGYSGASGGEAGFGGGAGTSNAGGSPGSPAPNGPGIIDSGVGNSGLDGGQDTRSGTGVGGVGMFGVGGTRPQTGNNTGEVGTWGSAGSGGYGASGVGGNGSNGFVILEAA